jgi:DNA primase
MIAPETIEQICASVDCRELVRRYGIEPNSSGNILCLWHEERTASCHVYADHLFCYACGHYSDAIEFVMMQEKIEFPAAVEHLSRKLALPSATVTTRQERPRTKPPELWKPYAMSEEKLHYCCTMAEALLRDERSINGIARARNWQPETIRNLALDPCIGLDNGKLVYLYSTGAKKRLKPLTPSVAEKFDGTPYLWLFGAQHSLWRADRILKCTERIHICEGETACISLVDAGVDNGLSEIAVAVPGARAWRDEWRTIFKGKHVTIWPDADKPGEELAQRIIQSLSMVARSIEIVNLNNTSEALQ